MAMGGAAGSAQVGPGTAGGRAVTVGGGGWQQGMTGEQHASALAVVVRLLVDAAYSDWLEWRVVGAAPIHSQEEQQLLWLLQLGCGRLASAVQCADSRSTSACAGWPQHSQCIEAGAAHRSLAAIHRLLADRVAKARLAGLLAQLQGKQRAVNSPLPRLPARVMHVA